LSQTKKPPVRETHELNFAFREKLNSVAEGFRHNYCYQCSACVADCPANNYSDSFNPRLIMLKAILGFEDELIAPDSEIWNCTNCYTCSERCPQDVRPVDVIIALKNLCVRDGKAPDLVKDISDVVVESGISTKVTSLAEKRRKEYGLSPIKSCPVDEIKKILEAD
jgi:heterodisulfide reductase subunit C